MSESNLERKVKFMCNMNNSSILHVQSENAKSQATNSYIINNSDTERILYIPDDVIRISNRMDLISKLAFSYSRQQYYRDIYSFMSDLTRIQINSIKVIGGRSLIFADDLFTGVSTKNLDLSEFHVENVRVAGMFSKCSIKVIDLSNLKFENLEDFSLAFYHSEIDKIIMPNNMNFDKIRHAVSAIGAGCEDFEKKVGEEFIDKMILYSLEAEGNKELIDVKQLWADSLDIHHIFKAIDNT